MQALLASQGYAGDAAGRDRLIKLVFIGTVGSRMGEAVKDDRGKVVVAPRNQTHRGYRSGLW